jgi:hypothetical protein
MVKRCSRGSETWATPTRAERGLIGWSGKVFKILFNLGILKEWMSINDFHELGLKCSCLVEESVRSSYPEPK